MMKIPAQIDLEAAPGRKSSHGVDFESQTTSKLFKIEKIRKSRKTQQNSRKTQIFDVQNTFSLEFLLKKLRLTSVFAIFGFLPGNEPK